MPDRYGDHDLQRDDSDATQRYGGASTVSAGTAPVAPSSPPVGGPASGVNAVALPRFVADLQRDLRALGFLVAPSPPSGVFDRPTEWAVREFQLHAKMPNVAVQKATSTVDPGSASPRYVDELTATPNTQTYGGKVTGIVNADTRRLIQFWLDNHWRCPVIVEAWTMSKGTRSALANENIWLHDEVGSAPRVFVVDLSGYYTAPTPVPPDAAARDLTTPQVAGTFIANAPFGGPTSTPPNHTWAEAELLPDRLTGAALPASGATRSTFKVVRAVSEEECMGFFDSINCNDNAIISCGPCHWTLGLVSGGAGGTVGDGELSAFLSFLAATNAAAFASAIGFFGVAPSKAWGADGKTLYSSGSKKFAGWVQLESTAASGFTIASRQEPEANWFKSWHWFYRFSMAGRTIAGWQQAMWTMARMRLRGILEAPWGDTSVANVGTRAPNVADVFTSEKAMAILLRWHVKRPADVLSGGHAGSHVRNAVTRATTAAATLDWKHDPSAWTDAHETALVQALLDEIDAGSDANLKTTAREAASWPTWSATSNPRHYRLDPTIGALATARGSFAFDTGGVPALPT